MKALAAVLLLCSLSLAQVPQKGAHELAFWLSSGRGVGGRTSNTSVVLGALRYGWVLTARHGPPPLRGSFEYAIDAVPAFLVFQAPNAYGVGINPVVMKWNFDHRGGFIPYVELNGGALFTSADVPPRTSHVNFTTGAALGVQFLGRRWNPHIAARFMHISSAGLVEPNPGVNTVQLTLGLSRFRH